MFRSRWIACAFVVCAAGFAHAAPNPEDDSLRYKFKEGDKLTYQTEQLLKMEMNFGGEDVTVEVKLTMEMVMHVGKVDKDGKAAMTYTFNRIRMAVDSPGGKTEVDTKNATDPEDAMGKDLAKVLRLLAETEVKPTIDARGRLSNVKLSEKVVKALKELPAGGAAGEMFTEEGMAKLIAQGGVILPEKTPTKGASWSNKVETKTGEVTAVANMEYTHQGTTNRGDRKLDKISLKPTTTLEFEENAPIRVAIKSQEGSGTVYFDRKSGRLIETTMTQEFVMEATADGQEIKQKIKSTLSTKLIEPAK